MTTRLSKLKLPFIPVVKKKAQREIQLWSKVDETEIKKDVLVLDTKDKLVQSFSAQSNINLIWNQIRTEISALTISS